MKKVLKKLPLLVLALVLVLAIKDKTYAATYGVLTYRVRDDGTIKITDCDTNASGALTIPDTIDGKKVTSIENYAFDECSSLTNITIPEGVISIGEYAFDDCSRLTGITIPNSVKSIGEYAFDDCSRLTNINVEKENSSYSSIDGILFNKTQTVIMKYPGEKKGTSYEIPDSVTSIGNGAFEFCRSLTNITIPNSVTSIGNGAFEFCRSLTNITIPESVTSIGGHAFSDCSSLTSITIPEGVTRIENHAFGGCRSLTSVTISEGITSIGSSAFYECSSLTNITIPDSVTSIENYVFNECSSLTSINVSDNNKNYCSVSGVLFNKDKTEIIRYPSGKKDISYTIPDSVTSIGNHAFAECKNLTSITIPNSVTSIGDSAFYDCRSLTSIEIPNSVTSIGGYAFSSCDSLINITIPEGVTGIGKSAFISCDSLINITIPNSVTSIGDSAFYDCRSLTSIEIPNSVTSIGDMAFQSCSSLTNITIPEGVTSIGSQVFLGCSSLINITIPNSVTSIGEYAFSECISLTKVLCLGNAPSLGDDVFKNTGSDLKIYAKNGLTGYDTNGWENYSNNIVRYEEGLKDSNVTFTSASQKAKIELADDQVFKEIASIKSYENYNKNVISIDSDGNITTLKNGTTNVKAVVQYFDGTEIILNEKVTVDIKPQVVGLDKTSYTFNDTKNMQLKATILPTQASNTKLNWTSDNKSVATVDGNGVVIPVKNGTCNITATTADGTNIKGNCNITVDIKPQVVGLDKTSYTFNDTKNMQLKATILPTQASNTKLNWTSDNKSVATVDGNGVVTPVKNGTCNITATTADGTNIKGNCNITVDFKVTSISFSTTSYTITSVNQTPSFREKISPSNAANKSVKWTSSDENVAKVSSSGVIKPVKSGTCKIIATTTDGTNLSASIGITVDIKATKITLDKTNINLTNEKYSDKITAKIEPSEASDKVKYTSSDTSIATVSSDGVVTAVGSGTCKITAAPTDGSKVTASCDVTVDIKTTGMKLDKTNYTFNKAETIKINPVITPSKASKKLTWASSNTKVAIVSSDGKVTPVGKGTCKITATTTDGTNLSSSCNITSNVEYQKGDVNRDGKVNTLDVYYAMKGIVNGTLTDEEKVILDVNGDSKANTLDINIIMRYIVGQIDSL